MSWAGPERRAIPPMTPRERRIIVRSIWVSMIVMVALILAVFTQSYEGRRDVVAHARRGCERAKLDRRAQERGWRAAEAARRRAGTPTDLRAVTVYSAIAAQLHQRSLIDCGKAFPSPSPFEGLWDGNH